MTEKQAIWYGYFSIFRLEYNNAPANCMKPNFTRNHHFKNDGNTYYFM